MESLSNWSLASEIQQSTITVSSLQHHNLIRKENGTNKSKFRMSKLLLIEIDLQENMLVARSYYQYFARC